MSSKKWFWSLVLAILAATLLVSAAVAGDGLTGRSKELPATMRSAERRGVHGQVTAVDLPEGNFTLQVPDGTNLIIWVDENTRFRGQISGLGDMEPGQNAGVVLGRQDAGRPTALLVVVPPGPPPGSRFAGEVATVDIPTGQFTLETRQRGPVTFQIVEDTVFRGAVAGLAELEPGMPAVVVARPSDGDADMLTAVWVGVPERHPVRRVAGEIASVDAGGSQFELRSRQGDLLTVMVDRETRFRAFDGEVSGLGDLAPGMHAIVAGHPVEGGLLARVVAVVPGPDEFDLRARGEVIEVQDDSFNLQTPAGRSLQLAVDEDTRFASRDGSVDSLEDLAPGMRVAVAGLEVGQGYLARIVMVAPEAPA